MRFISADAMRDALGQETVKAVLRDARSARVLLPMPY